MPRLGPERPYQLVYLPSDPATARLREDLSKSAAAVCRTAGMFLLCGLVFGAAGLFLLRRPDALVMKRKASISRGSVVLLHVARVG